MLGFSMDFLSKTFFHHVVLSDGVHLNDTGGRLVTDLVVRWLRSKGLGSKQGVESKKEQ
jgi:hypothetical protein